jgi:hypothetical protein
MPPPPGGVIQVDLPVTAGGGDRRGARRQSQGLRRRMAAMRASIMMDRYYS